MEVRELEAAGERVLSEAEAAEVEGGLLPYVEQDNLYKSSLSNHTGGINAAMGDGSVRG